MTDKSMVVTRGRTAGPPTKHLARCLRYLADLPSSFVLQQMQAVLAADSLAKGDKRHSIEHDLRKILRQYRRCDHDSPALLETLQIQLTLQCLSNLTEDGPLGAEKRLLSLEEELRDAKKKLADVSAAYTGMRKEDLKKSPATQIHNNGDGFKGPLADVSSSAQLHGKPIGFAAASVFPAVRVIDLSSDSEEDTGRASSQVSDLHNKKRKAEQVQLATLKRKRVSLGTKHPRNPVKADSVRTRQPEAKNAWYSHLVPNSHKAWASGTLTLELKRALSNVGHIEETIAGVPAPSPCDYCKSMGYDCRVYDPATADLYCREEHWNSCSRCFARGRDPSCTLY